MAPCEGGVLMLSRFRIFDYLGPVHPLRTLQMLECRCSPLWTAGVWSECKDTPVPNTYDTYKVLQSVDRLSREPVVPLVSLGRRSLHRPVGRRQLINNGWHLQQSGCWLLIAFTLDPRLLPRLSLDLPASSPLQSTHSNSLKPRHTLPVKLPNPDRLDLGCEAAAG